MKQSGPQRILLVTGMSGAGKSTVLNTLEDMGWEVVDNLPFQLLDRLLATRAPVGVDTHRPLALGIDSRTRGFDAAQIVKRVSAMAEAEAGRIAILFMDCSGAELERRYSETRRRHPLAADRPATDGIARERELIAPLRHWAEHVIDTTASSSNALKQDIRTRFSDWCNVGMNVAVMSFGFSRGVPRNADLMFDMRFLHNPYWVDDLRPLSGQDAPVAAYIQQDAGYDSAALLREMHLHGGRMADRVFITHAHRDHVGALHEFLAAGIPVHAAGIPGTIAMKPGDRVCAGSLVIEARDLRGHADPALGFLIHGLATPVLATGDALFAGSIGGCATPETYQLALQQLRQTLATLPDETALLPGHGPATTLGQERAANPFL